MCVRLIQSFLVLSVFTKIDVDFSYPFEPRNSGPELAFCAVVKSLSEALILLNVPWILKKDLKIVANKKKARMGVLRVFKPLSKGMNHFPGNFQNDLEMFLPQSVERIIALGLKKYTFGSNLELEVLHRTIFNSRNN